MPLTTSNSTKLISAKRESVPLYKYPHKNKLRNTSALKVDNDYLISVPNKKPVETASNGSDAIYDESFGAYNISSKES